MPQQTPLVDFILKDNTKINIIDKPSPRTYMVSEYGNEYMINGEYEFAICPESGSINRIIYDEMFRKFLK